MEHLNIFQASSSEEVEQARDLFLAYAKSIGFSLCFQNFDEEISNLPGRYSPPEGRLLLAEFGGCMAGCGALRKIETDACEMKRLYLRPEFRGKGLGRLIAEHLVADARQIGYRVMRLDTVEPVMKDAVGMYRRLGFREIPPYCENPMPGTLYMELEL